MTNLSNFPAGFDVPTDTFTGATSMAGVHAQHHDLLADAVINIEHTLGQVFSVRTYGANGTGGDDTTAINSAFTAASAVNGTVYFPTGNYGYNGTGLDGQRVSVVGDWQGGTTITLGATSRFINLSTTTPLTALYVKNISFSGGVDVIRSQYTPTNVIYYATVEDCQFLGYTGAAISNNSADFPYWKINRCQFIGANYTSSIGIALSGLTDACAITDCDFEKNRIHIKLRQGGNNAYIRNCDFLRISATGGVPRVDIWVVPQTTVVNAGNGLVVDSCKFGNELLDNADYRILYADEDTSVGTNNGTYMPKLTADSTGFVTGHTVHDCAFYGLAGNIPIVYSTTPNVQGCSYHHLLLGTEPFPYVIQFRTVPVADRNNTDNIFGPFYGSQLGTEIAMAPPVSNGKGMGFVNDPIGVMDSRSGTALSRQGAGDPVDYAKLLPTGIRAFSVVSATLANVADVYGGTDASELNFTAAAGIVYGQLTMGNVRVGDPIWVEFDLKQGAATALTMVRVDLETEGGAFHFRRVVEIGSAWRRVRILVPGTRTAAGQTDVVFSTNQTETGKVQIGRVRVYHSREPINTDGAVVNSYVRGALRQTLTALTYSATIATDVSLGNLFSVIATNGTAFTISTPTNPLSGQVVTYDIKNSSGGAHGVITWGAGFLNGGAGTVGTGAFTGIANTKRRTISFYYDGTNWVEQSRSADQ